MKEGMGISGERFVCYRLAGEEEPYLLLDEGKEGRYRFVFAPFHETKDCPKVWISGKLLNGKENLRYENENEDDNENKDEDKSLGISYEERFELFHRELVEGKFQKLVLSQPFRATHDDPFETFRRLCDRNPHSLVYLFCTPETGMWIGATPELLLRQTNERWETMALAGTKYEDGDEWDEKNLREQRMVCGYIHERLTPLCSNMEESATTTLHTGNLYHLCTRFSFTPHNDVSMEEITDALHPTPAVCGLPKEKAKEFILRHEGYNRRYYAGYLGPVDREGETHLYVNIRCAELHHDGTATLYAGSGLLADSTLENEHEEIVRKADALGLKKE